MKPRQRQGPLTLTGFWPLQPLTRAKDPIPQTISSSQMMPFQMWVKTRAKATVLMKITREAGHGPTVITLYKVSAPNRAETCTRTSWQVQQVHKTAESNRSKPRGKNRAQYLKWLCINILNVDWRATAQDLHQAPALCRATELFMVGESWCMPEFVPFSSSLSS